MPDDGEKYGPVEEEEDMVIMKNPIVASDGVDGHGGRGGRPSPYPSLEKIWLRRNNQTLKVFTVFRRQWLGTWPIRIACIEFKIWSIVG